MTLRNKILLGLGTVLLLGQFYRPAKNDSNQHPAPVLAKYPASESVSKTLEKACADCHSNNTIYPWYANIQPVRAWLDHHVEEGKQHWNLSNLTNKRIAVQNHKFEEVVEMVESGEMPMKSYTWMHGDAKLTEKEKSDLIAWAKQSMDSIKAHYPADSLVLKRK
jgi:hypothetical protein